jgi:hypothetical protein
MQGLTKLQIIGLIGFFIILIGIPISFSMVKQSQIFSSKAAEKKTNAATTNSVTGTVTKPRPVPSNSPLTDLQKLIQGVDAQNQSTNPTTSPTASTDDMSLTFGPTLTFKVAIEGRPVNQQSGKVFVGIAAGQLTVSPTYILTFTVDMPSDGTFKGLSIAGLNPGSTYTAFIKGASQIDTASTFTMSPNETILNNNQSLVLITGDLNEDNVINSADYTIARGLYGTTPASSNWNERADFNKDSIINNWDLLYINNNMGKIGASGTWISTPKTNTPTTGLITKPNVGGLPTSFGDLLLSSSSSASEATPPAQTSGYWLYVP